MKFSILICACNGEETLLRCLDSIVSIDYPKEDYEIIAIDNASTDRTYKILTNYDIRVVGCRKHVKMSEAFNMGVKNSLHSHLLIVDQRTVIKKDTLKKIKEINYSPLISGELNIDKYRSGHDTFVYLLNSKMYNPHFPQNKFAEQLWIEKKNYNKVSKNNALLYIDKILMEKMYADGYEYNSGSDDLYRKIVFNKKIKILSHTQVNIEHIADFKTKTNRDIVENGFRWAKKNLSKFNIFSFTYYLFHIMVLLIAVIYPNIFLGFFVGAYLLFLIYLSETKKDFWILFKTAPGEILRFYSGTLKYLTKKS